MKKLILLLLAVLISWIPAWSQTQSSSQAIQEKINQGAEASVERFEEELNRMRELLLSLETSWADLQKLIVPLSWNEFLQRNKNLQKELLKAQKAETRRMEQFLRDNPNYVLPNTPFLNSAPDYSHAFTHKYVFIGEAHDSASAPQEVINILTAARQARPHAKILLAQEFLSWTGEDGESLLKKPKVSSHLTSVYPQVTRVAEELNIDQLALEDSIFYVEESTPHRKRKNALQAVGVKTGNYFIWISPQDKLPSGIKQREGCSRLENRWLTAGAIIGNSPFGVVERNLQWAKRLSLVESFYDLILVYAGAGHFSGFQPYDLPTLLDRWDSTIISLYPQDEIFYKNSDYYDQVNTALEAARITNDQYIIAEQNKILTDILLTNGGAAFQTRMDDALEHWENPNLPVWNLITEEDVTKAKTSLKTIEKGNKEVECTYLVFMKEARVPAAQLLKTNTCRVPISSQK